MRNIRRAPWHVAPALLGAALVASPGVHAQTVAPPFAASLSGTLTSVAMGRDTAGAAPSALPLAIPAELQRPLSLSWTGGLDEAVQAIAGQIGYGFVARTFSNDPLPSNAPAIPVAIGVVNLPAATVIEQLGRQAGPK